MNTQRIHRLALALVTATLSFGSWAQTTPEAAGSTEMVSPGAGPGPARMGPRHPGAAGHPGAHGQAGPGPGRHGVHGPGARHGGHGAHGMPHGAGPAMMLLGPGLDRALDLVQATPQQRADIRRIAGAARDDLRASRRDARPRPEAWMAAWTADRVDAAALEAERQRAAVQRDQRAKRMTQAVVDIGAVLQPAQRRALAEHWQRMPMPHRRAQVMDLDDHAPAVVD